MADSQDTTVVAAGGVQQVGAFPDPNAQVSGTSSLTRLQVIELLRGHVANNEVGHGWADKIVAELKSHGMDPDEIVYFMQNYWAQFGEVPVPRDHIVSLTPGASK